MRAFFLKTAVCLTLAALTTTTANAGVRGKPTKFKEPTAVQPRMAQTGGDYSVNAVPVPADVQVTNETVIQETPIASAPLVGDPNCVASSPARAPMAAIPTAIMVAPVVVPVLQPMPLPAPMYPAVGCAACGGVGFGYGFGYVRGLNPAAAAAYDATFGPGLYRTGAEAGQYHFPYYSYRRPWYYPGQPSFHRSTDYVW